jgi:hypothetical protein
MAAHRYWRLLMLKSHAAMDIGFDEIDLRESGVGPRLSVLGNVTLTASDTIAGGGYRLDGIIDETPYVTSPADNAHAFYTSTASNYNKWIVFDFGSGNAFDINYVAITNVGPSDEAAIYSLKIGILQWSDTGAAWTDRIYIAQNPNSAGVTTAFETNSLSVQLQTLDTVYKQTVGYAFGVSLVQAYRLPIYARGKGRIRGTVKIDDTPSDIPVRRRVLLFKEPDFVIVGQQWSDAVTGAYEFTDLDMASRYTTLALDHNHAYRAEPADNLTPELMS